MAEYGTIKTMKRLLPVICGVGVLFASILGNHRGVQAQQAAGQPPILLTWISDVYVPDPYQGKALAVPGATITASFDLIENGRVVNLAGYKTYWYVNGKLIATGQNIHTVEFPVPENPGRSMNLRIQLPDYRPGTLILKTVEIPIAEPEIVIESPFPGGEIYEKRVTLKSRPFYFPKGVLDKLQYSWKIDDKNVPNSSPDQSVIEVTIDDATQDGRKAVVRAGVINPLKQFQAAIFDLVLTVKR